jgi:hypothetical protein
MKIYKAFFAVFVAFIIFSTVPASAQLVQSRSAAMLLNLSAFDAVMTLGHGIPGDGGAAIFKKSGAAPFIDSYIDSTSLTNGGSGYINGVYPGVSLQGGSGMGCVGRVTVAGNSVTLIETSAIICPGYNVGDVLIPNNLEMGGVGSGAVYTVSSVVAGTGSFVDLAGNRWQISVVSPNVLQFGVKMDWNGSDAGATNNRPAFLSGMAYAIYPSGSSAALVYGGTLLVPKGAAMLCGGPAGGFTIPGAQGLIVHGAGRWGGSQLVQCAAEPQNTHFIAICGVYTIRGHFGCAYEELVARSQAATTASNIATFYSISGQQFPLLKNVGIVAKLKACVYYDQGIGGAANAIFENMQCVQDGATANDGIIIGPNVGGTKVIIRDSVVECSPICLNNNAFSISGVGTVTLDGNHIEGHKWGYTLNHLGGSVSIKNSTVSSLGGGNPCYAITVQGFTPINSVKVEHVDSSCTYTVSNGHSGGANAFGNVLGERVF